MSCLKLGDGFKLPSAFGQSPSVVDSGLKFAGPLEAPGYHFTISATIFHHFHFSLVPIDEYRISVGRESRLREHHLNRGAPLLGGKTYQLGAPNPLTGAPILTSWWK